MEVKTIDYFNRTLVMVDENQNTKIYSFKRLGSMKNKTRQIKQLLSLLS